MEITWNGNDSFTVKGKNVTVVTNPVIGSEKSKGEVVLVNTSGETAELEGAVKTFSWPGEYEVRDVPVHGFQAWTKSRSKDEEEEKEEVPGTVIYYFKIDGVKFCHLGELGHKLTSEMINKIGDIDVLFMPTGEDTNLDTKKAMDVLEAIDPRVVIPMGAGDFTPLLKELGAEGEERLAKFVIKSTSELPDDKRLNVVLNKV